MAGVESAKEAKFIQLQEKKAEEKKEADLKKVELEAEAKKEEAKASGKKDDKAKKTEEKKTAPKDAKKDEEKKDEPKKREIVLERIYTVPMMDAYAKPQMLRGNAAITILRRFIQRHMKAEEKKVKISLILNNLIRKRGSGRPLKKVKIKATKDKEGVVVAEFSA